MYGEKPSDFTVGQRVELHPVASRWMMGDRYATVERVSRVYVHVRFDRSGASCGYHPSELRAL